MKSRPILFSAPMIRALLAGTKTQTRRVVKPQQPKPSSMSPYEFELTERDGSITAYTMEQFVARCPHGVVGDRLWVKETYQPLWSSDRCPPSMSSPDGWALNYVATGGLVEYRDEDRGLVTTCKPAIFMPRWASRIELEITEVRVQRPQAISEADAQAEGIEALDGWLDEVKLCAVAKRIGACAEDSRAWFAYLWDEINGRESWDANPFVWAISFKRVTP